MIPRKKALCLLLLSSISMIKASDPMYYNLPVIKNSNNFNNSQKKLENASRSRQPLPTLDIKKAQTTQEQTPLQAFNSQEDGIIDYMALIHNPDALAAYSENVQIYKPIGSIDATSLQQKSKKKNRENRRSFDKQGQQPNSRINVIPQADSITSLREQLTTLDLNNQTRRNNKLLLSPLVAQPTARDEEYSLYSQFESLHSSPTNELSPMISLTESTEPTWQNEYIKPEALVSKNYSFSTKTTSPATSYSDISSSTRSIQPPQPPAEELKKYQEVEFNSRSWSYGKPTPPESIKYK